MVRRYPCQAAVLFVFGILTAKGIIACREAGAGSRWMFLAVLAVLSAGGTAKACIRRESLKKKKLRQALILLFAFGSGTVRMHAAAAVMEHRLADISDGQAAVVQGRVIKKQPQETQYQTIQWTVCLTDSYLKTSQGIHPCGDIIISIDLSSDEPVIGNTIILSGKVRLFHEARNDGNFDERRYYQNQGYTCRIYGDPDSLRVMDEGTGHMREYLYSLQQSLVQVYQSSMPQEEAGAVCAMLLGDKSQLSSGTKQLYQRSGIAHILAISGLHISILGAAVFRLLRNRGVSYRMAAAVSMGLLALFGCMAGMGISTMRAVVMFGIYLGAACCGRAYDSANGLAAAMICLLLHNPCSLFLAGFQFSFLAVAGVLLGKEICRLCRPKYRLAEAILVSLSIQMLTLPLTAWYYFEIPVYAVLLNLFVLPLMGAVLLLGLSGGIFGLPAAAGMISGGLSDASRMFSGGLLAGCKLLLGYFSRAGELFLRFPGALCVTGRPKVWQMAGYYLLLAACACMVKKLQQTLMEQGQDGRPRKELQQTLMEQGQDSGPRKGISCWLAPVLGFAACLVLLFLRLPGRAEVVFLDVGQGDGIYIRTSDGMDIMIDGGSTNVKQAGTYRILPFLKSQGIAGIDYWFLSHLDQDHISGFQEIAQSGYPVGEVVLSSGIVRDEAYEKMMRQLSEYRIKVRYLEKGDVLRGRNACFRCLGPDASQPANDRNAASMVLLYEDHGISGFFSGDISKKEEQELLRDGQLTQAAIYKAAHHGSKHSNAEELLARLRPAVSVISCAEDNDYGHPGAEAEANMNKYSRTGYTMRSGQIRILYQEGKVEMRGFIPGSF